MEELVQAILVEMALQGLTKPTVLKDMWEVRPTLTDQTGKRFRGSLKKTSEIKPLLQEGVTRMKGHMVEMAEQFKVRTGLRAGDSEDCAKGFQEFVEKCNLASNPELMSNLGQQFAQAGLNLDQQFADAGQNIGDQWREFGMSFIPH